MCCNLSCDVRSNRPVNGTADTAAKRERQERTNRVLVRSTMRHRLKQRDRNNCHPG